MRTIIFTFLIMVTLLHAKEVEEEDLIPNMNESPKGGQHLTSFTDENFKDILFK